MPFKVLIDLIVQNEDKTIQTIRQPFLLLRPTHSLSIPLLGLDFLTNDQAVMSFIDGKFMITVNGFKLSLSHTNPPMTKERFCLLIIQV